MYLASRGIVFWKTKNILKFIRLLLCNFNEYSIDPYLHWLGFRMK